jgi:hypothetical protein
MEIFTALFTAELLAGLGLLALLVTLGRLRGYIHTAGLLHHSLDANAEKLLTAPLRLSYFLLFFASTRCTHCIRASAVARDLLRCGGIRCHC